MYVVYNQEPTGTNGILGSVMEIYFKGLNILFQKYTVNPISTYIRMHAVHQVTQFQKVISTCSYQLKLFVKMVTKMLTKPYYQMTKRLKDITVKRYRLILNNHYQLLRQECIGHFYCLLSNFEI